MNRLHLMLLVSSILMSGSILQSCSDDNDNTIDPLLRPTALVTVIPAQDGSFVMQLDNETVLTPINMPQSPFKDKEVRALVNYTEVEDELPDMRAVNINWIDSIRTKMPVPNLNDSDENDLKYGTDPIEIINDWVTIAEDGYLTLRIRTLWGSMTKQHTINLLVDPDDPYKCELRHNAHGDLYGTYGDALIAFNLNSLPKTDDNNVRITLTWMSFNGPKSTEFDLQLRSDDTPVMADYNEFTYNICVK